MSKNASRVMVDTIKLTLPIKLLKIYHDIAGDMLSK
ncbi:hypothetical protein Calni_1601 [Calditerrivibrio nitroreducens DSM 19672]|uniref:Uncharacterized protein n=1 Tax=Calditerrivibrio nitroreducens (strain DSM 19672 / NBRC 101217 / Yu37-1) TaxID=768670 RepID=E4TFD6_CALNY|nr:hypothetical protein Calni_1601 [Calditerrivibrio nitroreducens DSM 19672]